MESAAVSSLVSCRDPCAGSLKCPYQGMLPTTVEQADRLDAAPDRLRRGQQFDPRPALAELSDLLDLVEANHRDDAALVADIAQEARRVGKYQQPLGLDGRGNLHRQPITVDIDGNAFMADRGRRDQRQVAVVQQQAQEFWLEVLDDDTVVAVQHLDPVTLLDAQVG